MLPIRCRRRSHSLGAIRGQSRKLGARIASESGGQQRSTPKLRDDSIERLEPAQPSSSAFRAALR